MSIDVKDILNMYVCPMPLVIMEEHLWRILEGSLFACKATSVMNIKEK